MKLAKIESKTLKEALESGKFPILMIYLSYFYRTDDGEFISQFNYREENWDLLVMLQDYFCNEMESKDLNIVKYKILKIVEL